MKLDNRYKIMYAAFLMLIVGYFAYSLQVGKLFYEFSTKKQWDGSNTRTSGVNRFYHK
ncbi:MAG: hypothetical protein U5M51_10270 [Emticicia sp.]|nr:hypothetical protein [Emticicia sp.]